MGYTAPPTRWYHWLGIGIAAAVLSMGDVGVFLGSFISLFVLVMVVRTFGHAAASHVSETTE